MKTLVLGGLLLSTATLCQASISFALDPTPQSVSLGSQATFTLDVSGLGGGLSPALGTYDFNIFFDPALLNYNSITFGTQLDPDMLGSNIQTATPGTGTVEVFELSLNPAADLVAAEPSSFTLATLVFDTLATGTNSPVTLSALTIGDENGNALAASLADASITITGASDAPEPNTFMVLGVGLLALAAFRKVPELLTDRSRCRVSR
jgi:hypothetical protein